MTGFTFLLGNADVFVETNKTRKTKALVKEILHKLGKPDNASYVDALRYCLRKAECDIHTLPDGRQYYEIHGDGFGGRGSFVDDGKTIIISLKS